MLLEGLVVGLVALVVGVQRVLLVVVVLMVAVVLVVVLVLVGVVLMEEVHPFVIYLPALLACSL